VEQFYFTARKEVNNMAKTGLPRVGQYAKLILALDLAFGAKIRAACTSTQLTAYNAFIACAQGIVNADFPVTYEP
jgi:hypothetical protein